MRFVPNLLLVCILILSSRSGAFTAEAQGKSLDFTTTKSESVTITGSIVGKYFFVDFSTLNGTVPTGSKVFIAAFSDQQIPYYQKINPVVFEKTQCDKTNCSQAVEAPITSIPYTVGVGSSYSINTISATLNFFPGTTDGVPFKSSVKIEAVGINSIVVSYVLPNGYRPSESGAWIGIWAGDAVSTVPPLGTAKIDSDQASDTQSINGLTILNAATYTVGLASGPDLNDMAASTTFMVFPY